MSVFSAVADMAVSTHIVVRVNKTPKTVVIPEGSSVTLHCCVWTTIPLRLRASWHFNPHGAFQNGSKNLPERTFSPRENTTEITAACLRNKESHQNLVTYDISNFSQSVSGWYNCQCKIEIPVLSEKNSSWIELVVENPPFDWTDWWLWIAVGVASFILVILLILCIVMRRRQLRNRDREDPIYANMRRVNSSRQPSPRPETLAKNNLKIDTSYENTHTPNMGQRYERGGRRPKR